MKSCLYECEVMHARFSPRRHRFAYRIFLFALDLDELPDLPRRTGLFGHNRRHLYALHERDFLPVDEPRHPVGPGARDAAPTAAVGLKQRVAAYLRNHGLELADGSVLLVTLPRIAGYLFNPVSFYFCRDREGRPLGAIAEVTNTFREMKPFFVPVDPADAARGVFRLRVPKHFYVSPYSDVDVAFDFHLRLPGEQLAIRIDDYVGEERTLTSTLAGPRRELTTGRLAWFTLKYPLLTLRIISLIHWHALLLWAKRLPWFAKAARAADQRDLYRPHSSLKPAPLPPAPSVS
jgi:DUF1365 family protein